MIIALSKVPEKNALICVFLKCQRLLNAINQNFNKLEKAAQPPKKRSHFLEIEIIAIDFSQLHDHHQASSCKIQSRNY